jgi:uncharacterized membrane protein YqhA
LRLPEWLVVHDVDELEDKLAQVVVVVLGTAFLGHVSSVCSVAFVQRHIAGYAHN